MHIEPSIELDLLIGNAVDTMLQVNLRNSTWAETHPIAYKDLLSYKEDITIDLIKSITTSGQD